MTTLSGSTNDENNSVSFNSRTGPSH